MGASYTEIIARLKTLASPTDAAGMARFGIHGAQMLGISVQTLRGIAREIGRNHTLALQLWDSGIHEARILASVIDEPCAVDEAQLDAWVIDFDSWDLCDQCCSNLFVKTPFAYAKAVAWSERDEEFVKRAGFVLIAQLASKDKKLPDNMFPELLAIITREATDERNFVRKAVNWALREIGKRNRALNELAIATAAELKTSESKTARWIGSDALRELGGSLVYAKLKRRERSRKG